MSYIVTTIGNQDTITIFTREETITGLCTIGIHFGLVIVWTGLVQIVGISITPIVASDAREGRNVGPPVVLLVQAIWTSYLALITLQRLHYKSGDRIGYFSWSLGIIFTKLGEVLLSPFVIIFAKLLFKFYAWYKAGQLVALGRNPRLIYCWIHGAASRWKPAP
jgi:hypothetical protein